MQEEEGAAGAGAGAASSWAASSAKSGAALTEREKIAAGAKAVAEPTTVRTRTVAIFILKAKGCRKSEKERVVQVSAKRRVDVPRTLDSNLFWIGILHFKRECGVERVMQKIDVPY
jgi:hypothetical protein